MNRDEILEFLEENELSDIKEISYEGEELIIAFKYYFDGVEIEAANEYANEEYKGEIEDESWYYEYFLPYLSDFALDNVEDILDECAEEYDMNYEFIAYELTEKRYDHNNFVVVFSKDEINNIDDIILYLDEK
ncbi:MULTISPECIES: hypothetical protein [Clostridium]|uniref:DUF2004 domain-containing protein n=1 Tax=Clostridium faecium TaxID=2762223 RepID=A0ABR8YQW7_9CLOT|nr:MULTISPECIES: hypothetical protein [Clostridium]MBD8046625.1 hypothetical protein [Clostridium faecium]MDU1348706.1 hypothetical protein [Clostridium argentinense]